jgi:hypothetical protein
MKRKCPVHGCNHLVPRHFFVCSKCWSRISLNDKKFFCATWNKGKPLPQHGIAKKLVIEQAGAVIAFEATKEKRKDIYE